MMKGIAFRNGAYEAKPMFSGKRFYGRFDTEQAAEAWLLQAQAANKVGQPIPDPNPKAVMAGRIADMAGLVAHCRKMRWNAKKSGEHLAMIADLFVAWVGPKASPSEALTVHRVHEYVEYRQSEKRNASATINRHLSAISVLAEMARKMELIDKALELPWQTEGKGRVRYYTEDEETMLFGTLLLWGLPDYHDLCAFLIDTGCRLGEADSLRWVDVRGRSISFVDTKTGTDRGITGTPRVLAVLQRMKAKHGHLKGPFAWLDRDELRRVWNRLRAHFEWMGEDTVVHTFRHTCCSRLVIRGVDILRVKEWMGHTRIETTMRYSHLAPKHLEGLADILASFNQIAVAKDAAA